MRGRKCERPKCYRAGYAFGLCHAHHAHATAAGTLVTGKTDAARSKAHLEWLLAEGVSLGEITRISGISWPALNRMRTAPKVLRRTEEKLLRVTPDWRQREAGEAKVPAIGTARRLQALVAIGYTGQYLSDRFGWPKVTLWRITGKGQPNVEVNTARMVAELFDELSMTPGPCKRARSRAKKLGWVSSLAWDDIDDPNEKPDTGKHEVLTFPEKLQELKDLGVTKREHQAERLGYDSLRSFERQLFRLGIQDSLREAPPLPMLPKTAPSGMRETA